MADPAAGIHFGRARGPMLQSAVLGTFLITSFAATWTLLAWLGVRGRLGVVITAMLLPIYLAAVYFTYTRSVWMGAGLALAVVLGLILRGRTRHLALGGLAAAAVLVLAFKGSDLVSMKRETSGDVTRESTYMRGSFLYVSWQMFKDRPLTGVGFGQYPRTSTYYLSDRDTELHLEAIRGYVHHITFMSILVELGIVGLVLYLLVLFDWIRGGWLLWRDPRAPNWMRAHALVMLAAFAPFFCQLLFRDVSYSLQECALIFLLAGVTSGLRAMQSRQAIATAAATHSKAGAPARAWPAPGQSG
jgi:O-antigen ligase